MHWMSILTAGSLACISAWLVFFEEWPVWVAFGAVGAAAVMMIALLLLLLVALTPRDERKQLREEVVRTMAEDARRLLDALRFKRD